MWEFFSFVFLALVFCVAVSGGCGGRYSSNYAVSSQDVTPTPVPENPTSGDEVGYDGGRCQLLRSAEQDQVGD